MQTINVYFSKNIGASAHIFVWLMIDFFIYSPSVRPETTANSAGDIFLTERGSRLAVRYTFLTKKLLNVTLRVAARTRRPLVCHPSDQIYQIKIKLMYTQSFSQSPARAINKASPKNGSN